jgi:2-polyprenyl-3-methyl-5-hydroxy-6-metoxy-1,4-benzoquinol methylase
MVYLSPRPPEQSSGLFYQNAEYLPFASLGESRSLTESVYRFVRRMNLRWKRSLVDHYWRGARATGAGRLLDVGCGTGEFLNHMKKAGWQVEGLERDENASSWARNHWSIDVRTGSVDDLGDKRGVFDVVTLWHVLEHVYNPLHAVEILADALSSRGLLIVAAPNVAGVDSRFYQANWIALDLPRHVNHFSARSLVHLLSGAGFEVLNLRQLPFDAFFNTLMSEQLSARKRWDQWFVWPLRVIRAAVIAFASLIGGSRVFGGKSGATVVGVFRKTGCWVSFDFIG